MVFVPQSRRTKGGDARHSFSNNSCLRAGEGERRAAAEGVDGLLYGCRFDVEVSHYSGRKEGTWRTSQSWRCFGPGCLDSGQGWLVCLGHKSRRKIKKDFSLFHLLRQHFLFFFLPTSLSAVDFIVLNLNFKVL